MSDQFLGPGEEFFFQKETGEKVPVTVKAFKSTDEGVAFLIEAEGKVLYHAGDLNNWVWEGEPEEYNFRMSEAFHSELLKIAGNHIDVAFMLLDPRQGKDFYLGMDDFMHMVGADIVFPMHFWGDFGVTERFKTLPCAADYAEKIMEIRCQGKAFSYSINCGKERKKQLYDTYQGKPGTGSGGKDETAEQIL